VIERYTRPGMGRLWTLENRFATWLEVELAVTRAWHDLGRVPAEALAWIEARAGFDTARILEIEETTRHDVIAFLTAVEERVGEAARWIHLGCTSSDIVDTAGALLLVRAGEIIDQGLERLLSALSLAAHRDRGLICMGRTHGVHAEPTSFGLKWAGFHSEFSRHRERFARARENVRFGKISGAVGTHAFLPPELEARTCELLGLVPEPVSTQVIPRDRHAEYFTTLAALGGGIERLCVELRHLQRTEVLEATEGFSKGQKGSSAMPHKKNPISAENLTGLSRLLRSNALAAMENMALWHERDISHSSVERVIMPDSTILADYMLHRLAGLMEKLVVHPDRVAANLMASHGLFFSQRVLTALIEAGQPRQKAYETVQAVAMRCWEQGLDFPGEIRAEPAVTSLLTPDQLEEIFDLGYYLRYEEHIFSRVFGRD
jgi:adenylosuccinate lyase